MNRLRYILVRAKFMPFEFMVALFAAFSGFWLLSPWYSGETSVALDAAVKTFGKLTGVFLLVMGLFHLGAIFFAKWPHRLKARKISTFTFFITFLFLAIIRAEITGPSKLVWLTLLIIGLTEGLAYLSLSVDEDEWI